MFLCPSFYSSFHGLLTLPILCQLFQFLFFWKAAKEHALKSGGACEFSCVPDILSAEGALRACHHSLHSAGDIWVWQNEALQNLARNWGKIWNYSLESFQKEDHLVPIKVSLAPSFSSAHSLSLPQARPCRGHGLWLLNFPRI